jgi:DNA-binding HxlR family transcriptional regulator
MHVEGFCPRYLHAVELVGRRWTGAIVRALLAGPARYNEIRTTIPDLSDRMLSERLRELESEGIVVRSVIPDVPVRVEYSLTDKGHALEQAIVAIAKWAEQWVEAPAAASPSRPAPSKDAAARAPRRRAK